jgi:DNA-binding GntR family transcriptional regulator
MASVVGPRKIVAQTVREQTYEQLKELIIKDHFPLNYRFDLNQLSKELGISKTPIGDAIRQLESEGLLVVKPRSGTYLNPLTLEDVTEAFAMRQVLETGSTDIVLCRITDEKVAGIRALHEKMKLLLSSGEYQDVVGDFIELDKEMHAEIIRLSGLQLLIEAYDKINTLLLVSRVRSKFTSEDSGETVSEHEDLVLALENRSETAYRKAVTKHIQGSIRRLETALPRNS